MLKQTAWKKPSVLRDSSQERHLEQLEGELKKNPCPKLEEHILRLKVAWGRACKAPDPAHQAA